MDPIASSQIRSFKRKPIYDFRFEKWYNDKGRKMWSAACQFDIHIEIEPTLEPIQRGHIEYRQFISGGVWVKRGNRQWSDEPNGNPFFPIPPYKGLQGLSGYPSRAVSGTGLSLTHWKEDGQIESGGTERFGYRDNDPVDAINEKDIWKPEQFGGNVYHLRDTPSISGEWGSGDTVEVWIELHFLGYVVQIDRNDDGATFPTRILKEMSWKYFWPEQKLRLWMDAQDVQPGAHVPARSMDEDD